MFSRLKWIVTFVFASVILSTFSIKVVLALDCLNPDSITSNSDRDFCYSEIERLKNLYLPAQEKNKKDLAGLQAELNDLNRRIDAMAIQLKEFAENIAKREEELAFAQRILDEKARTQYKDLRLNDWLYSILSAPNAMEAFKRFELLERVAESDRKTIERYVEDLAKLKEDKENLEKNKTDLAAVQKEVAERTTFLAGEVAKVDQYLAELTAKQQAFLAAKLESLGISRSAYNLKGGCSSDINPFKSPGFSPAFGFFSFGVPNRVGMNQYGAKGRAEAGQGYDQILRAYYEFGGYQNFDSIQIRVNNGNGINTGSVIWSGSLEDYVKRIYEVPGDWPMEALKTQAIAARSYALAATNNGANSICANEYCQVFKTDPKGGAWESAANDTAGKVMVQNGQPIKSWFSAVHGGFAFNSGDIGWNSTSWTKRMVDTPGGSVGSFSDLLNNAYDRSAQWFYCDWGGRSTYNGTGWLTSEEVADIVNVIQLARNNPSAKQHLYQVDKSNPEGTDTWDAQRVRQELGGSAITGISNITVNADFGSGMATTVNVDGQSFDAKEFKNYFNLRAPSNIQIVGPLFNVEKR